MYRVTGLPVFRFFRVIQAQVQGMFEAVLS
jgi:hypothetical protein